MNQVILFKSAENSADYNSVAKKCGYNPIFLTVLDFIFINLEELYMKLKKPDSYDGLVLTSPRAVDAISQSLNNDKDVLSYWNVKSIFVVGDTTNRKLYNDLGLQGIGYDSGNASALSDFIIKQSVKNKFSKPLLFPCGNIKSEVLPNMLAKAGVAFEPLDVYKTQECPNLFQNIKNLTSDGVIPKDLIFFSPSGVGFVIPKLREVGLSLESCRLVAIGPSTENKIRDFGLVPFATAEEPTPEAIFSCLTSTQN